MSKEFHVVPAIWPVDLNTAVNPGDYVSMKGYNKCTVVMFVNDTAGTCVVTALQAKDVAATGEKSLSMDYVWKTGGRIKLTGANGVFTVGETITGTATGTGVVHEASLDEVTYHTKNATAFVDGETVTGGTSGYTAKFSGTAIDTDLLCKFAVASDTFTIPDVHNKMYVVELLASDLDVTNGFDCLSIYLAQAGGAGHGAALYILSEPTFYHDPMKAATFDA
jgi:hypothetical protein